MFTAVDPAEEQDGETLVGRMARLVGGRPRRGPALLDAWRAPPEPQPPASALVDAIPTESPSLVDIQDRPVASAPKPSFLDKTAAATSRAMWDQGVASLPLAVTSPVNRLWQALKDSADTAGRKLGVPEALMERRFVDPVGGFTSGAESLAGKFHDAASGLGRGMIERDPAGRAALQELQGDVKKFQSIQDRATGGDLSALKELGDPRLMVPNMASLIPSLMQAYIFGPTAGATTMTMGDAASSLREHEQRTGQPVPPNQAFRYLATRAGEIPMEALSNRLALSPKPGLGRIPAAGAAGVVDPATEAMQRTVENLALKSTFAPETRLSEGLLQEAAGAFGSGPVAAMTAQPDVVRQQPAPTTAFRPTPETAEALSRVAAPPQDRMQPVREMLQPNQEQRATVPVAESQAPAARAGDGGAAPARDGGAPDLQQIAALSDRTIGLGDRINAVRQLVGPQATEEAARSLIEKMDRFEEKNGPGSAVKVVSDVRAVYNSAAADRPAYLDMVRGVARDFGGTTDERSVMKSMGGAIGKTLTDYGGDASRLKDALRSTIVSRDVMKFGEILDALRAKGFMVVGNVRNAYADSPSLNGYRDAKINLRLPNGTTTEVQINHPRMIEAKDLAHDKFYKRIQEIEREGNSRGHFTPQMLHEIYAARTRENEIYRAAAEDIIAETRASNSSLDNSTFSGWANSEKTSRFVPSGRNSTGISPYFMENNRPSRSQNKSGYSITTPPSVQIVTQPGQERQAGETDKAYAKRVIDRGLMPADLPEQHERYFNMDSADAVIPVGQLVSTKTAAENEQGGGASPKRMRAAYDGLLGKRDPITVRQRADGRYDVVDGNGTLTGVTAYGWKSLPVRIEDRALGAGDRTAGLTDTLFKGREASGKLIADRSGKRPILGIAKYIKANPESGVNFTHEKVSGFPPFVNTAQDFEKEILRTIADIKGRGLKEDALWYETAGRTIWKYADGDLKRADVMTRLTAKFAQTMGIRENTTSLIQALEQMRKGEPIKAGRYPNVMRKEIDALLAAKGVNIGIPGINRKLASFYWNLWDEVLLAAGRNEQRPHLATVDQHINSYAQHQKVNDVSPQEYAYSDMLMREATRRLNKEGYGQKLIGRTLRPKEVQAALWGLHKKHVNASGLGTNEKIVSETAWNYPEYMARATDVVQAETVPSSKVSGVSALPREARQRYHKEAVEVLRHGGVDDLANRLDLTRYSFESSGGYDGSINPNIVVGVLASKESKQSGSSDSYHRFTHDAARMYATAWQYVYRQDAVPFYRADISIDPADLDAARARRQENIAKGKTLKKDQYDVPMMSLGFDIAFKNGLTDQLERDTFALLRQAFGDSIGYTKTGHDSITVINYRDGMTGVPFLIEDAEFERKINEVTRGNADVDHVVRFGAETYYEEHDWKADPAGAALEDKIREAGRPDLLEWLRDRRAAADKVTARHEQAATEDRAQGVGEASAFYGRNPIDEIGVGKNSADHPAIFYLVPGSMGSRRNVGRPDSTHREMLNAAAHDIEAAGFPVAAAMKAVRGVVTYNGSYAHWHAAWLPDHRVIGFSEMRLNEMEGSDSRQKYLRGWWAHELTHAIDDAGNGSISSGSPRLDFFVAGDTIVTKGDVVTEVAEAYAKGGKIGEFFEYPLAYAKEFAPALMKEELLAQLSRLYTTNKELMRRELPVSFKMMEDWYAQIQPDSLAATRAGLQAALRAPGAGLGGQERQLHGVDQAVSRAARGVLGVGGAGAGMAAGRAAAAGGQGAVTGTQSDLFQSAYSGEKYAVNLNLDRYDTAGAIKGLIEATAKNITDKSSRGETATHDKTLAEADRLGISEDQVLAEARKGGKPMSLPEARAYALAVRQLIVTRAEATKHFAETAFKSGSSQDRAEAMASLYHLAALQAVGMNLSAEAGRLLNSYRILAGVTTGDRMSDAVFDEERQKTAEQVLEQMFGGTNNVDDILSKVALMSTQQLASPKMRKALLSRRPSVFLEIWKAGLLSGPQTHIVNMASNALTALIRAPETAAAAGIGSVKRAAGAMLGKEWGKDRVYLREAAALMAGMTAGTITGARDAWQIIRHGEDANDAGKSETTGKAITGENFGLTGKTGKAVDIAGEVVRTPFRALAAEDAIFKGINRTGTLYALAYRQAIKEGAKNVSMRARELVANPTREMLKAALEDGLYFTFNNQLGAAGQKTLDILHSTKAGRLAQFAAIPFFRTPVNILKFGVHRSPLAPLTQKFQDDFKAGGARRDMALARMMTGTAIMSTAFALAASGLLTGGGEPEKERKAADRIAGWRPYSIRVGDKFFEYRRLEPLGMLLGMAADLYELSDYMSREESEQWLKMAGMAFAQNVTSKTFLSGLTNVIKAISEPQQYGDNYLGALTGSFVPAVVGQAARARDPWERDTDPDKNLKGLAYAWDDVKRDIQARIPGQREKLPLRRDALGQPMPLTDSPSMFNPIRTGELRADDPVAMELANARARVSPAKGVIQNVKLTPEEKEAYGQASGTVARARLERLFASPAYQGLPQFLRDEKISKEMEKARTDVRNAIVGQMPAERRVEAKIRQLRR